MPLGNQDVHGTVSGAIGMIVNFRQQLFFDETVLLLMKD